MNRRNLLLSTAGLGLLAAPGILRAQAPTYTPNPKRIRIGTGSERGNYHWATVEPRVGLKDKVGGLFAEGFVPVPSEGSRQNMDRLKSGEVDACFVQEDVLSAMLDADPTLRRVAGIYRISHVELLHFFVATSMGVSDLDGLAKVGGELGVGSSGSGSAETWRILTGLNPETTKFFSKISPATVGVDRDRLAEVRDTRGTAQLVVEGPGSDNSAIANAVSALHGQPALTMLNVKADRWKSLKRPDGGDRYQEYTLAPKAPVPPKGKEPGTPGFYDKLLPGGSWFSGAGITTIGTRALFVMRPEFREALSRDVKDRMSQSFDETIIALRKRTDPFGVMKV